ncbi:MAG: NAD(P)/FAD-dependent oxidoreductase [Hymenobacteraceae bacterium]|nr:NAD(P)/FAD-dependent oxidoreductase [Hymenobacteraceae bacterium]MDX5397868.1 NAD(P)/FAD-dependent oxidoreductase [Hymenobacteraceae bacterium]MDX5513939.1 NAD(P)/FAD-dependent oxidoreductase [Hymenobacteraceae bacterium]
MKHYDVGIVGSGFGGLTAAALLAKRGLRVAVWEKNKYAGGCATSYKRKNCWFETGATTLVGLDENMPLRYFLDETGIHLPAQKLDVPMQVHLPDGQLLTRYPNLESWIQEAERVFGKQGQRKFWEYCYQVSREVWRVSLRQRSFPFSSWNDFWQSLKYLDLKQLGLLPLAFKSTEQLLKQFKLQHNQLFRQFVDEQLLITAQNYAPEVNALFGATALCYTLYSNWYVPGGLRSMVKPVVEYIMEHKGILHLAEPVKQISHCGATYTLLTDKDAYLVRYLLLNVPLNNVVELFPEHSIKQKLEPYLLPSEKLNSAFTMGIAFTPEKAPDVLHHQVHVPEGLTGTGSKSIFISFSKPDDETRAPAGQMLASVSTHVHDPAANIIHSKAVMEDAVFDVLEKQGLLQRRQVVYYHSATPGAWITWTGRKFGMVGGYPQYISRKPWQLKDARLDHKGAYLCGDTVYPGQGIPGVCLSGILAAHKLVSDHFS